jgi:hypothetical protein
VGKWTSRRLSAGKSFSTVQKSFFVTARRGAREDSEIPGQGGAGQSLPWLARILH